MADRAPVGPARDADEAGRAGATGGRGADRRAAAQPPRAGQLGIGALETDDCRAAYERLKARGVEFIEEPEERFHGVDAGVPRPHRQPLAP